MKKLVAKRMLSILHEGENEMLSILREGKNEILSILREGENGILSILHEGSCRQKKYHKIHHVVYKYLLQYCT